MDRQDLIADLIKFGQLDTSVYEEVQYESQIGHLRYARFMGLREGQDSRDVVRSDVKP
jgi:hypothetical protein